MDSQLAQDSVVSATVTLADENLQDEPFRRGVSDSQVHCLDRDERPLFSVRGSPLVTPQPVWKVLTFLQRCAEHISPGAILYRIEVVSLFFSDSGRGLFRVC